MSMFTRGSLLLGELSELCVAPGTETYTLYPENWFTTFTMFTDYTTGFFFLTGEP